MGVDQLVTGGDVDNPVFQSVSTGSIDSTDPTGVGHTAIPFQNYDYDFSPVGTGYKDTENNPIMQPGPSGDWDEQQLAEAAVLPIDNERVAIFYNGTAPFSGSGNFEVGLAVSYDGGKTFNRYSGNPILSRGASGSFDDVMAKGTSVIRAGDEWRLYYHGKKDSDNTFRLAVATSDDLINWSKSSENPIIDADNVSDADNLSNQSVIKYDGTYYNFCARNLNAGINLYRSDDGVTGWETHPDNPVIDMETGTWYESRVQDPDAKLIDGTFYITFGGEDSNSNKSIGMASSDVPWTSDWTNEGTLFNISQDTYRSSLVYLNGRWQVYYDNASNIERAYINQHSSVSTVPETNVRLEKTAEQGLTGGNEETVTWDTVATDERSEFDSASNSVVVDNQGDYKINIHLGFGGLADQDQIGLRFYRGNTKIRESYRTVSGGNDDGIAFQTTVEDLAPGAELSVNGFATTDSKLKGSTTQMYFEVNKA